MRIDYQLTFEDYAEAMRIHRRIKSWWVSLLGGCVLLIFLGLPLIPESGPPLTSAASSTPPATSVAGDILTLFGTLLTLAVPFIIIGSMVWFYIRLARGRKSRQPWDRPDVAKFSRLDALRVGSFPQSCSLELE